ncbi:hypothetical protein JCM24511_08172, partial [Saitozyma sp. JCM 24511]
MGFIFAPVSYTIIAESQSVQLRALSAGVRTAACYVAEISTIFFSSCRLNPKEINLVAKPGYVWISTTTDCLVVFYFHVHEKGDRFYRELDILFHHKVPARKLTSTQGNSGQGR